ncbi:MAG: hypothetical protein QXU99_03900 [Candidatus Bathyarchaeia archaeon]
MNNITLSTQLKRAGEILQKGAADQITDYTERFNSIKNMYDGFLDKLIKTNFDAKKAISTARAFFNREEITFVAIDGTEYTRQMFDLIIFFSGSYSAKGIIRFTDAKPVVEYSDNFSESGIGVSTCIPMYINEVVDVDQSFMQVNQDGSIAINKPITDEMVVNNSTIANWIMTFSEFYLAYKTAKENDVNIILLDRSLSNMHSSLLYDTRRRKLWGTSTILRCSIENIKVDANDLALNRHRMVNFNLRLPPARGDYLRYSAIYHLEDAGSLTFKELCKRLNLDSEDREQRLKRFLARSIQEGYIQEKNGVYEVLPKYRGSWSRVKSLVEIIGKRLFENGAVRNPLQLTTDGQKCWLTTLDLAFLSLFCFYMLVEECWRKHILLIGITKDTTARDFKNHLIPICVNEGVWNCPLPQEVLSRAPDTDRMLLQYMSIYNYAKLPTPWSLIEYDAAFRVIIPELEKRRRGYVSGAIKNRITPERSFLKSYIQLSEAKTEPRLRSNVLFIDRLVYPEFDVRGETLVRFRQEYGGAVEPVDVILFKHREIENKLQNLVMVVLKCMAESSIPEVFGHNMPLFIADSVAKWHNNEVRRIIDSTSVWVANNRNLRRFLFYMSTFRERRTDLESGRRES